jgi:high-affinity Fe2+/Pb2+ permease
MIEIPTILVAFSALILVVILMAHDEKIEIPIKVFAIASAMQFVIYMIFTFMEISVLNKQFITRANVITVNLALSIILLVSRVKK